MEKRTKIICTLGPSVDSEEKLVQLIQNGMDVARLNFSHGTHEEQAVRINRVKQVRTRLDSPCAIMLDTKGPEIRTGLLEGGKPVLLTEDSEFTLTRDQILGNSQRVSQTSSELPGFVKPGTRILLDDGLIELTVSTVAGEDIVCKVKNTGELGQRKSVNVPGVSIPLPAVTDKDREDILFGIENGIDFVALSFVKNADAVREVRQLLRQNSNRHIGIIAKIENADAIRNVAEIIEASDAVMVARGDLGVEVPPQEVPHLQKQIIRACNRAHKPVIIATQMLESMTMNPRPTRAEATDVANAIYDGADCVMLSGETAAGAWPIEAVQMMREITVSTEKHYLEDSNIRASMVEAGPKSISHAVGTAAVETALAVGAKCLVCPTMTGRSARLMASLRPEIPIYAVAPDEQVMRYMQLFWGVTPLLGKVQGNMRHVIDCARDVVLFRGFVKVGDIAVFTCGDRFTSPIKNNADGTFEKFAPANVMYVVQIRSDAETAAAATSDEGALISHTFFERS